jgi:UDP-4-amino-4-deoxy-L-arabinose-oxoglutarate aminotransferase
MDTLTALPGLSWPATRPNTRHARHLFPIWIANDRRDAVIHGLQEQEIGVMVNYRAIHLLSFFQAELGTRPGDFPIAERLGDAVLSLPFYPRMPEADVERVAQSLSDLLELAPVALRVARL